MISVEKKSDKSLIKSDKYHGQFQVLILCVFFSALWDSEPVFKMVTVVNIYPKIYSEPIHTYLSINKIKSIWWYTQIDPVLLSFF